MLKQRIAGIDSLRGAMVVLVVLWHCSRILNVNNAFICFISSFFIPCFFCISGFLYDTKSYSKTEFLKKVVKLLYPYLSFSLVALLVDILCGGGHTQEIIKSTLLLKGYKALWYIPCFILGMMIVELYKKLNIRMMGKFFISIFLSELFFAIPYGMNQISNVPNIVLKIANYESIIISRSFVASAFIIIGMIIKEKTENRTSNKSIFKVCIFCLFTSILCSMSNGI